MIHMGSRITVGTLVRVKLGDDWPLAEVVKISPKSLYVDVNGIRLRYLRSELQNVRPI